MSPGSPSASVFFLTVAAMASKAVAVTLPLLFLVVDFYPLRRWSGERSWWRSPHAHRVLMEATANQ